MVTNEQVELLVKDTSEMQAQILRKVMLATLEQFHDSHMALKKRAEQAESRNKRLVELLRVEVAERCGKPAFICTDDDCCYFGKPATKSCTCHVNKLSRHHAMSAELLREVDNGQ